MESNDNFNINQSYIFTFHDINWIWKIIKPTTIFGQMDTTNAQFYLFLLIPEIPSVSMFELSQTRSQFQFRLGYLLILCA